ncbi:bck1-like resistance to osmotic shock [Malassezia sp. CBS 17886]|nr:bck1-like resistance to osmotic shock [Malassezia sp. CBS 17886]
MQSPLIALPLKASREVDIARPVADQIRSVFEQAPSRYADDLQRLNQVRHDAIGRSASAPTGRDLLYKWFHMLEMLELRFVDLKTSFPWCDAFLGAEIVQQSLAYEKACVIFNIAARVSAVAAELQRQDTNTDAVKRAYAGFRQAAGYLEYINNSFLHAPSQDMGTGMLRTLTALMLLQASEVFLEKSIADAKGAALIAKLASHVAAGYDALAHDWDELSREAPAALFPATWRPLVAHKAQLFASLTQYHRARVDGAAGAHGVALARATLAERLAKDAVRAAGAVGTPLFHANTSLPPDAAEAAAGIAKAHLALCTEQMRSAERDNDLVYHDTVPPAPTLPPVEKTSVATPIPIRESYAHEDVQRVLGPELFADLVPLSVHESASVYSEEKAQLVRAAAERVAVADEELRAALASLQLPSALRIYGTLAPGAPAAMDAAPSAAVRAWSDELRDGAAGDRDTCALPPGVAGIQHALAEITGAPGARSADLLRDALASLDEDGAECERQRVAHGHRWTQAPSAAVARTLRRELTSHRDALAQAQAHDAQIAALWDAVHEDASLLLRGGDALDRAYRSALASGRAQTHALLDLDDDSAADGARALLQRATALAADVQRGPKERERLLNSLKGHVHNDDIVRVLLLNRRVQNVEPQLFANELAKFAPLQTQIDQHIAQQAEHVATLARLLQQLATHPGTASIRSVHAQDASARAQLDARLKHAYEAHAEVRAVLAKALQFYAELGAVAEKLARSTATLVAERRAERARLLAELREDSARVGATPASAYRGGSSAARASPGASIAEDLRELHALSSPPPPTSITDDLRALSMASPSSPHQARAPAWPAPPAPYKSNYAASTEQPPPRPPRA